MIRFSHTICYVKDVPKLVAFYEKAFGIKPKFVHESGTYAELETGATTLAFAQEALGNDNLPAGYIQHDIKRPPLACEIVFTVDDVQKAYEKAVQAGAFPVAPPKEKPWGQTVGYVRDPEGVLIELASPM
jgi:lactoylglutathione lyase